LCKNGQQRVLLKKTETARNGGGGKGGARSTKLNPSWAGGNEVCKKGGKYGQTIIEKEHFWEKLRGTKWPKSHWGGKETESNREVGKFGLLLNTRGNTVHDSSRKTDNFTSNAPVNGKNTHDNMIKI